MQRDPIRRSNYKKDFWDKLSSVGPLLIAVTVTVIGGSYGYKQAQFQTDAQNFQKELEDESRRKQVFTELLTQRERSDNELRSTMFKTLLEAYFGNTLTKTEGNDLDPGQVRRQVTFLDILARNFETIDIKPLFEDLDEKLTRAIYNNKLPFEQRRCFFGQRERLRHVGRGLASKQVSAISSLKGTMIQKIIIGQYKTDTNATEFQVYKKGKAINIDLKDIILKDGMIMATFVDTKKPRADRNPVQHEDPRFSVTFYDMPYIDNTRYASGKRLTVVLEKYLSPAGYKPFLSEIKNPTLRKDYGELEPRLLRQATIRLILFPENYLGLHDRPYLEEVIQKITKGEPKETSPDSQKTGPGCSQRIRQ